MNFAIGNFASVNAGKNVIMLCAFGASGEQSSTEPLSVMNSIGVEDRLVARQVRPDERQELLGQHALQRRQDAC